jgi:hypothetical protein
MTAVSPKITRVEPPNWWVDTPANPVRLLISGSHLEGARIVSDDHGLTLGAMRVTDHGRYAFVDVRIAANARIGSHRLRVVTPHGTASAMFSVDRPLARNGRFQGFSPDDVIYLIMVDRFADGDRSNDNPAAAPGLCSRNNPQAYHGGDLQGVIDHLAYLKDLGITTIWITPVYENVNHPTGPEKDPRRTRWGSKSFRIRSLITRAIFIPGWKTRRRQPGIAAISITI